MLFIQLIKIIGKKMLSMSSVVKCICVIYIKITFETLMYGATQAGMW